MRILVVSDSHGNNSAFTKIIDKIGMPDMVIHCGDYNGSEYFYSKTVTCPLVMVSGNNDFSYGLPSCEEIDINGKHIFITHGHRHRVYYGTQLLIQDAKSRGACVALYGHTHVPSIEYDDELRVYAVNPGSLTFPRQEGHRPSYVIMDISDKGEIDFKICFL